MSSPEPDVANGKRDASPRGKADRSPSPRAKSPASSRSRSKSRSLSKSKSKSRSRSRSLSSRSRSAKLRQDSAVYKLCDCRSVRGRQLSVVTKEVSLVAGRPDLAPAREALDGAAEATAEAGLAVGLADDMTVTGETSGETEVYTLP